MGHVGRTGGRNCRARLRRSARLENGITTEDAEDTRGTAKAVLCLLLRVLCVLWGEWFLPQRLFDLAQPVGPPQYFARLGPIGRAYNAILLHQVDQVRRPAVADAQAPLQQG